MKTTQRFILLLLLAGSLHLTLGWEWTAASGLAAGCWIPCRGWLVGGGVVGLDYLFFVVFSFAGDPRAVQAMTETMGGFLGNMPSFAVVALTVVIGILIGATSGAAGTQLRSLIDLRRKTSRKIRV